MIEALAESDGLEPVGGEIKSKEVKLAEKVAPVLERLLDEPLVSLITGQNPGLAYSGMPESWKKSLC